MGITQRITVKKYSLIIFALYLIYRIILDFIYVYWVSPVFGYDIYSGLFYELNVNKLIVSYLIIGFFAMILPKGIERVSFMVLQLHFIIMIIPLTSIYALVNHSTNFMIMVSVCFFVQIILIKHLPLIKLRRIKHLKNILICLFVTLTIIVFIYSFKSQDIHLSVFNYSDIYKIRSELKLYGIISYLITWQYRVINPILIIIFFLKRRYTLFIFIVFLQVFLFLMYPYKEIIFSMVIIFIILFIERMRYKVDLSLVSLFSIGSIISIIIYELWDSILLFQVLLGRLLFVPAIIKFQHYDFFLVNKKLFYSEGLIGRVFGIEYPYSVPSGYLIGSPTSNENTGYLAYAYDNAGFLGMVFMSLFFVFILILVDSLVKNENKKIIFSILVYPMIMLNDGDLLTLLLTGGFFLYLIFFLAYKDIDNPVKWKGKTI